MRFTTLIALVATTSALSLKKFDTNTDDFENGVDPDKKKAVEPAVPEKNHTAMCEYVLSEDGSECYAK